VRVHSKSITGGKNVESGRGHGPEGPETVEDGRRAVVPPEGSASAASWEQLSSATGTTPEGGSAPVVVEEARESEERQP